MLYFYKIQFFLKKKKGKRKFKGELLALETAKQPNQGPK